MKQFLLEIGTEEMPAGYIRPALDALEANLTRKLAAARIRHGASKTYGTPRRLVVCIDDLADRQEPLTEEILGPPERIAFDDQGNPAVPANKFAEKVGVALNRLRVTETEKGRYLSATITDKGTTTKTMLQRVLPDVILATPFPKTMRWSDLKISFARPIQSVLALLDKSVVSFKLSDGLRSGRFAWGHMFMHHKKIKIDDVQSYVPKMREAHVVVDPQTRKGLVRQEINAAAAGLGGQILTDDELLDIVTNLVEIPIASGGKFDDEFLALPREILITSMREHQKYFAVVDTDGRLMPCFVAVNNTRTKDLSLVAKGHERVLRARLSDAQFFFGVDSKESMDDWGDKLKGVLFQARLGSMYDKVQRVAKIGAHLSAAEPSEFQARVARAAGLCKADLVSQVVGEFPKLQGIMGRVYATKAGEPADVAAAIEEHYRPIYSGGSLPETRTGAILAIADKLDTICGCFSVGLIPTGASDPYALRRQGIGIVQIMLAHKLVFSLPQAIRISLQNYTQNAESDKADDILTFIQNRIARMLAEEGYDKDVIFAVIHTSMENISNIWKRVEALQELKGDPDFEPLAVAFKRVVNILRKTDAAATDSVNPALFLDPSEGALHDAYLGVKDQVNELLSVGDFEKALRTIATLRVTVDRFFKDVMVMTDDTAVRKNRLALLQAIAAVFNRMADFSKIAT